MGSSLPGKRRIMSYSDRQNLTHWHILLPPSGAAAIVVKDPFLV